LQDSMPRAALLSLHARVEGVGPAICEHRSLAQLWGPRYQTYVVPKRDFALFSLGRLPDNPKSRQRAERIAQLLRRHLDSGRMLDREAARALGMNSNAFRYAAPTGTVAIRWDGARAPMIWTVPAPGIDASDACRELARRHLHVFGPTTADGLLAGRGSRGARPPRHTPRWRDCCCRSPRRSATSGCWPRTSPPCAPRRRPRHPLGSCRAGMPTFCSTGRSGHSSSRGRTSSDSSGRPASGPARSSSTERSAGPGGARSTSSGSSRGDACRVRRATRSRPRRAPCRFRASIGRSR